MARPLANALAATAAFAALLFVAPVLPELQPAGRAAIVSALPLILLLAAMLWALSNLANDKLSIWAVLAVAAAGTVVGVASDANYWVTLPEALLGCAAGLIFARFFVSPQAALAIALFVGAIDLAGALAQHSARDWPQPAAAGDALNLQLPLWHAGSVAAGQVPLATVFFASAMLGFLVLLRLPTAFTAAAMAFALAAAYVLEWQLGSAMPQTLFVVIAFLALSGPALLRALSADAKG